MSSAHCPDRERRVVVSEVRRPTTFSLAHVLTKESVGAIVKGANSPVLAFCRHWTKTQSQALYCLHVEGDLWWWQQQRQD
jgi:hypothetical protein